MGKWKNIPPHQRSNWSKLNEGQKRYAYEQYKLALVRRGLPIDHDRPNVSAEREEGSEQAGGGSQVAGPSGTESQSVYDTASEGEPDDFETAHEFESDDEGTLVGDSDGEEMAPPGKSVASTSGTGGTAIKRKKTTDSGVDDGFSLPGTAMDQADQGGNGFEQTEASKKLALPRPTLKINSYIRHFSKYHRFLSWGISYQIITETQGVTKKIDYRNISTPFAQIPWDRLYLYLNSAEFSALPKEAYVVSMRVTVKPRNVRVAFPTNSTATELATLNQNKDICYIKGANIKLNTVNVQYLTFADNQPMIPLSYELDSLDKHKDLNYDLYGRLWTDPPPMTVPRHQMGIPTPLPTYMLIPYPKQDPESGYPCLQHYYRDFDADAVSGQAVVTAEYKPVFGLIKTPRLPVHHSYPIATTDKLYIPRSSMTFMNHRTDLTLHDASMQPSVMNETEGATECLLFDDQYKFDTVQIIEKSQIMHRHIGGPHPTQIQPSLHVAVQPVPALNTNALAGKSNSSFTDTQGQWEILCEIEINTNYHCPYPLYNGQHAQSNESIWYYKGNDRNEFVSSYNGLMQLKPTVG